MQHAPAAYGSGVSPRLIGNWDREPLSHSVFLHFRALRLESEEIRSLRLSKLVI